jgi:hypothetical protein
MPTSPADLGVNHGFTRLSTIGPSTCSGSIAALATAHRHPALHAARLGTECLYSWPFSKQQRRPYPLGDTASLREPYAARFKEHQCRLCSNAPESLYHLVNTCQDPSMVQQRTRLWGSAKTFLKSLLQRATTLTEQSARLRDQYGDPHVEEPSDYELHAARQAFDTNATPPATAENNFLLYWTLLACPWPARIAHCNGTAQPTASTLGKLFDNIELPNSRIRALSNDWDDWAEKEIVKVAKARLAALEARGVAP